MIEATFWRDRIKPKLVSQCRLLEYRHHFERIENAVASGGPDVDFCIKGIEGKIELKYAQKHPVRETTPVLGKGNGLRRSQVIWIAKRLHAGGRVFVAIGTPVATWLIDVRGWNPRQLMGIEALTAPGLREISAWHSFQLPGVGQPLPLALIAEPPIAAQPPRSRASSSEPAIAGNVRRLR